MIGSTNTNLWIYEDFPAKPTEDKLKEIFGKVREVRSYFGI